MSKKQVKHLNPVKFNAVRSRIDADVLARWEKTMVSAETGDNVINIFDVIGGDFFSGGFTAKMMAAALKNIGTENDVVVAINSPGGDFFEGVAIYNLLAEHKGHVTVKVVGLAASAASVITMAADTIKISQVGFIMIHNAWIIAMGNRNDLRAAADYLEPFDSSMVDLYSTRTGLAKKQIEKYMDAESWFGGQEAVDNGFADELINVKTSDKEPEKNRSKAMAKRSVEMALANQGFSRKDREEILSVAFGERDAAETLERDAEVATAVDLLNSIKTAI